MGLRQRRLCMRMGFLFVVFGIVFVLSCEGRSETEGAKTDPAPADGTFAKPKELTFELVEGIKFADGTEVKSITKADIEALRDRPIDMGGNDTDGVTLTNSRNDKLHVRTCREYDAAIEDGYYPSSTYDISMGSWFKYPCGTLDLLERASIPRRSFLPTSDEEVFDLELLPLSLFPVVTDFEQAYGYDIRVLC